MSPPPKSQKKKVHYESDTKGHRSHSSRDSGIGSSSSASRSDRASSGTSAGDTFTYQEIKDQRFNIRSLQEALDAANDKIAQQQALIDSLNADLAESNKERRSLKKHNSNLTDQLEKLQIASDKQRRNSTSYPTSPRTRYTADSSSTSGATQESHAISEHSSQRWSTAAQLSSRSRDDSYRRPSSIQISPSRREVPAPLYSSPPPAAPQPPPNPASPMYPPGYAGVTYSTRTQPVYSAPITRADIYPNDGLYHQRPL
ncbi:hypothetical protein B7463_g11338, partial [Scytalidium lignicola]